jgi:tetratricopeptide (TPR) repeat protein
LSPTGHVLSVVVGAAVIALAAGVSLRILARPREITARRFGLLALVLTCVPVSNFLPVYPAIAERWVFTPEHFLYAPIAVLSAFATGGISRLWSRMLAGGPRAGDVVVTAAAATFVLVSIAPVRARQARLADAETVYRDTLAHSPSPRACFNLGVTLLAAERYAEAIEIYERCAMISPSDSGVYAQLGVAYQQADRPAEAAMAYERAVSLDPGNALAWSNYASLDAQSGAYEGARAKWRKALDLDASFLPARRGLEQLGRLGSSE